MSWIMIVLLLVAGFLILVPMLSYLSAKRLVGRKIDSNLNGNRMLYFYSQNCSPCRAMTPVIDRLARQYEGIVKVDVREDPETSRIFNIRATPTLVMMKDNVVTQVALGAKTESQLETMLKKLA